MDISRYWKLSSSRLAFHNNSENKCIKIIIVSGSGGKRVATTIDRWNNSGRHCIHKTRADIKTSHYLMHNKCNIGTLHIDDNSQHGKSDQRHLNTVRQCIPCNSLIKPRIIERMNHCALLTDGGGVGWGANNIGYFTITEKGEGKDHRSSKNGANYGRGHYTRLRVATTNCSYQRVFTRCDATIAPTVVQTVATWVFHRWMDALESAVRFANLFANLYQSQSHCFMMSLLFTK